MSVLDLVEPERTSSMVEIPSLSGSDDEDLLLRLRSGDADAFAGIVDRWSRSMLRLARSFVSTDSSAQEIVQETWLAVFCGLDRFEGRSTLKTWVFCIVSNRARTRGVREARIIPWSSVAATEPAVVREVGHSPASTSPANAAIAAEMRRLLAAELLLLPDRQREVVSLRDVHGLSADEVCSMLAISSANQRVLLHRGRARLRTALDTYYHQK